MVNIYHRIYTMIVLPKLIIKIYWIISGQCDQGFWLLYVTKCHAPGIQPTSNKKCKHQVVVPTFASSWLWPFASTKSLVPFNCNIRRKKTTEKNKQAYPLSIHHLVNSASSEVAFHKTSEDKQMEQIITMTLIETASRAIFYKARGLAKINK